MFVDELELVARGGRGGNGVVSFRREKYVPHGGPDGGDGGDGGSVYFFTDPSKHSFLDLRYRHLLKAANGTHGRGKNQHGARGADLYVPVPPGTIVRDENKKVLADLTIPQQRVLVAAGGRGGKGNARFASPTRKAPRIAEKGLPGEEKKIKLELKVMAQVGLVGFPNAGKSTLLSRITAARPTIASYPFTTLVPNLGVVKAGEEDSFVIADLPGLIEGAHEGAGLGHKFLRHVERNLLLLFLIDLSPQASPEPASSYNLLQEELTVFNPALAAYPRVVVGNKLDIPRAGENLILLQRCVAESGEEDVPVFGISAVTGEGVEELIYHLHSRVKDLAERIEMKEEEMLITPEPAVRTPLKIDFVEGVYEISGSDVEKMAARTDFENEEALQRFQNFCRRIGLEKELKKIGAKEGDTIRIGSEEFFYYDE
ncbi:MAG: GTPase ObgE [Bacillota bacterium]|nr:GTPase ObgE [Bacillota bacterium]